MQSFNQWWEENQAAFEKTIGAGGEPVYTRREIAHAAWVFSSLSFSQTINQVIEENLRKASHEV